MPARRKIIIDTDIADDIDDAIALSFALGSPEFDILGVTVVYGDVETRAKVARKLCRTWGRPDIPVFCGFDRPVNYDWFPGTTPEPCSQRAAVAADEPLGDEARWASRFICQAARRCPGEVTVVTLGAMTNVGAALCAEPEIAHLLAGVYSLAGSLPPHRDSGLDWNVGYDVIAARAIAASGVKWTAIGGGAYGRGNSLRRPQFEALDAAGLPASKLLLELVLLMNQNKLGMNHAARSIWDIQSASTCDVAALAALLEGDRFDLQHGRIDVDQREGHLTYRYAPNGPHRWACKPLATGSYIDEILRRLLSAPR